MALVDACKQLHASSRAVRDWLLNQPNVKEESLTDWLLYDVSRRVPNILYKPFKRHQEARETGADWEWWFVFPTQATKFRVQAKKLQPADNYAAIAYTNRFGLQLDKLLADAQQADAIPLYAFYSAGSLKTMCGARRRGEGVFIAGAQRMYNSYIAVGRQVVSTQGVLSASNPFSCFACCPLLSAANQGHQTFLTTYYANEVSGPADAPERLRGLYAELPRYVASLLQIGRGELPEWWESEYASEVGDVKALVICDLRQPPVGSL